MNNIASKTTKMLDTQNCLQNHMKNAKATSQPSVVSEEVLARSYLSTTFGLSFMISSGNPTRSSA